MLPGTRFVVLLADTTPGTARTQMDSLWTPYDFHVDGTRSHCGIDSFTLARTAVGWQISSVEYTVQRRRCPVSPLGPPK